METYGNEIVVQQGEDFNLDIKLFTDQDNQVPFIVGIRKNPYFVVTVASTKYEKNMRYVASWWNSLNPIPDLVAVQQPTPMFFSTVPVYVGELASSTDIPLLPGTKETYDTRCLYQYTLTTEAIVPQYGHKPYHYFYYEYNDAGTFTKLIKETIAPDSSIIPAYQCRITFNFMTEDTSKWASQNYMYQITLVDGELLEDTLEQIALAHGIPYDWPETIIEQYKYVKEVWPNELQPDIDATSPLGRIDNPQVILQPTKLTVYNNLRQLI